MPLQITLRPYEALIINNASIRNGGRTASLLMETQCRFLRESEIIHERDANTPCKKICVTLQVIHLSEDSTDAINLLYAQAVELMNMMPSAAPFLLQIQDAIAANQTYVAIKAGRQLMYYERDMQQEKMSSAVA